MALALCSAAGHRIVDLCAVPVLPFMMFFDRVVSFLRMYGRAELRRMVDGLAGTKSFTWTIGVVAGFTGAQYLIGIPRGGGPTRVE